MISDTWYLTLDIWYLISYTCYRYLIYDIWFTILFIWNLISDTWYSILDTWYLILDNYYLISYTWYLKLAITCKKIVSFRSCSATRSCFSSYFRGCTYSIFICEIEGSHEHLQICPKVQKRLPFPFNGLKSPNVMSQKRRLKYRKHFQN